jgi:hypothetical protein
MAPLVLRPLAEANWLQALVTGQGEVWPLSAHVYGSRGRAATLGSGVGLTGTGRWSGAAAQLDAAETVDFPVQLALGLGVTVMAWVYDGAWRAEVLSWLQGELGAPTVQLQATTAGVVTTTAAAWSTAWSLQGPTGQPLRYTAPPGGRQLSDVYLMPRALHGVDATTRSSWASALGLATAYVRVSGALVDPSTQLTGQPSFVAVGAADDAELLPANRGSGLAPELRFTARLEEV